jgi:hypothetical protein
VRDPSLCDWESVDGTMLGMGGCGAGFSASDALPGCMTASPPGRILPLNASLRDAASDSNFVVLTLAIDHITRNMAMSSVIMSA